MASQAALLLDPKALKKQLQNQGQQNANNSPRRPPSSMAPPGTASATDFSNVVPRNSSSKPATVASTSPHLEASNSDPDQVVEFTNTHDPENDSDTKRSYYDVSDSDDGPQPRRLIEDIYGVEQRRQQPMKKRKMEKGLKPAPITRPVVISGNTGIGEFIKEGDVQQSATTNLSDVVDLTDDTAAIPKDDDELQVTGFTDLSLQRVCYGKIENALINASKVPRPKAKSLFPDQWPPIKIDLHREPREGDSRIAVVDPHGEEFGTVDAKTAPVLCRLMDSPVIDLQIAARLDTRKIFPGEVPGVAISTAYRVSLTLYGERRRAEYIGKILSQHNVWLATPNFVEAGVPLFNPHAERRRAMAEAGVMMNSAGRDRQGSSIRYEARTAEEVTDSVTRMFNQLISADMEEMDPPAAIKTPLLSHQKQALWFMMKKEEPRTFKTENSEDSSLWRIEHQANGRKQYKEIISGIVSDSEPSQVFGGLLADEMGLGKTLSILSLTLKTLSQSKEWADQKTSHELIAQVPGIRNTRTTLLVVPLSAVSNWVAQIQEHLDPGSIKYYIFHGPSRTNKFLELAKYDLVITTYSTILSEISGRNAKRTGFSPLTKMCMFRIVLDEAHTIREQNAQQTQAILSLHAQRRWSVTGTPVQNRLEDLLSVTKFIKLYPYDEGQSFRQHIINPMKTGDPNVLKSLRVLIDSFTLRRVKDKINLPPREDKIIYLEFSEKEKQVHEFFRTESQVMMRVIAGETRTKLGGRMYHHVLKAMMILRQVSAHGKELLDVEDRERIKGLSMHDAIDLEENEDSTASATDKKAYGMFTLMQESSADQCACCSKRIEEPTPENGNGEPDRNLPMAYFLPCYDVLCPDCFTKWASNRDTQGSDGSIRCQVCEGWILPTWTTITPVGVDDFLAQQAHERQSRRQAKTFGEYEGPHTKTRALIQHLQDYAAESAKMVGQPPIKTVIFSAWTSHLDLIEIALRDHGFNGFKRLDGTMSLPQRSKSLEVFAKDDSITILLATIGAGGVGLNLTSASRVFVMEPQYNPAAVAQAVDRVHRLGQTRPVETVQFIMKESIEEKILDLAKKKQQLAEMSMNRKLAQKEMQAEKMEEYRALFK